MAHGVLSLLQGYYGHEHQVEFGDLSPGYPGSELESVSQPKGMVQYVGLLVCMRVWCMRACVHACVCVCE